MYIVAIGWIYVVLMMSITEESVVAGIMTFLMYGVIPLSIFLYIAGAGRRKRNRAAAEKAQQDSAIASETFPPSLDIESRSETASQDPVKKT